MALTRRSSPWMRAKQQASWSLAVPRRPRSSARRYTAAQSEATSSTMHLSPRRSSRLQTAPANEQTNSSSALVPPKRPASPVNLTKKRIAWFVSRDHQEQFFAPIRTAIESDPDAAVAVGPVPTNDQASSSSTATAPPRRSPRIPTDSGTAVVNPSQAILVADGQRQSNQLRASSSDLPAPRLPVRHSRSTRDSGNQIAHSPRRSVRFAPSEGNQQHKTRRRGEQSAEESDAASPCSGRNRLKRRRLQKTRDDEGSTVSAQRQSLKRSERGQSERAETTVSSRRTKRGRQTFTSRPSTSNAPAEDPVDYEERIQMWEKEIRADLGTTNRVTIEQTKKERKRIGKKYGPSIAHLFEVAAARGQLTRTHVEGFLYAEWQGSLCLKHKNPEHPELDGSNRPCHCTHEKKSQFDWERTKEEEYIAQARKLQESSFKVLETSLRSQYTEEFARHFPYFLKWKSAKIKNRVETMQMIQWINDFHNKAAPTMICDWTRDQGKNLWHKGKLTEKVSMSSTADEFLQRTLKSDGVERMRCTANNHRCRSPGDLVGERCVPGHYENGLLRYATKCGVSLNLFGKEDTPLSQLEWQSTLKAFACTDACTCDEGSCDQKWATTRGCQYLTVLTVLPGKGRAVFALEDIPRGAFLSQMAGTILKSDEWGFPEKFEGKRDPRMLLVLPDIPGVVLSPDEEYNVFMFYNHSCAPNVVQAIVVDERRDPRLGRFAIHARMDIKAGTELVWDYHVAEYLDTMHGKDKQFNFVCYCGFWDCRYSPQKWEEHRRKNLKCCQEEEEKTEVKEKKAKEDKKSKKNK